MKRPILLGVPNVSEGRDGETIAAAVAGFRAHFGLGRVRAMGMLPLHHVSGLMAWMRCAISGGEYRPGHRFQQGQRHGGSHAPQKHPSV